MACLSKTINLHVKDYFSCSSTFFFFLFHQTSDAKFTLSQNWALEVYDAFPVRDRWIFSKYFPSCNKSLINQLARDCTAKKISALGVFCTDIAVFGPRPIFSEYNPRLALELARLFGFRVRGELTTRVRPRLPAYNLRFAARVKSFHKSRNVLAVMERRVAFRPKWETSKKWLF